MARAANLLPHLGRVISVGIGSIFGIVASMLVGGAVAAVTVVGVIDAQTGTPDGRSPVNVSQPVIDYGSGS
jgi:hypothetical protein